MLNNLKYDMTLYHPNKDPKVSAGFEEPDYVESMKTNRAFRCFSARNIYFT